MPDARVSAAAPGLPSAAMPPALAAHLDALHSRAIHLEQVARALRLLIDVSYIEREILEELAGVITAEAVAIETGLDTLVLDKLAPPASSGKDPVLPIYRKWLARNTEWFGLGADEEDRPEADALRAHAGALHAAMIEQGACSMEGIAALAHAMWVEDGPGCLEGTEEFELEVTDRQHASLAAIWRAASGCEGLPPQLYGGPIQP